MGKSPGKWIKTVLFGKKSSKSNLPKDAIINKKTSINSKPPSKDSDDDSMVISSPLPPVMHTGGERKGLAKTAGANLPSDTNTIEVVRSIVGMNNANEDELINLEQAAIKAQAAFRGVLARQAFGALKGIIRLQAQVRGHLVRRQAVATLSCMRAIVEFQALTRGRRVRLHMLRKYAPRELAEKKRGDFLGTSLRSEKLSTNAFGTKLVASSYTTMPLRIQYDPTEPNSAPKWLHRWSSSHFWDPLPKPKNAPNSKPKRKQTKLQPEEPETARPKRIIHRVPTANLETNPIKSENPKPTSRKKSEKPPICLDSDTPNPNAYEQGSVQPFLELNEVIAESPQDGLQDDHGPVELNGSENHCGKENQKTRRRSGLAALPSYMAATESAKAKLRAQAAAKAAEDGGGGENGFIRRHSLPSSTTGKPSLQSPQIQKPPLLANGKGRSKSNKPQIFARDDKMVQTGWKR